MKLNEITPESLRCSNCQSCPGIYETERGTFVIIGKQLSNMDGQMIAHKVGNDELAIEIPKEFFSELNQ